MECYQKCEGCSKELTLEEADKHYNKYKATYCDECIIITGAEHTENEAFEEALAVINEILRW